MRKDTLQWLIPAALAVGTALALWFYWSATHRPPRAVERPPADSTVPAAPASRQAPAHPMRAPGDMSSGRPALRPLPPLDRSDEYFRLSLLELFGESLAATLADSRLIERVAVTLDNLPREEVAQRMRPLNGVDGPFLVDSQDDSGEFRLDPENYRRYDPLVSMVASADMAEVADLYRRFYPLLQTAYVNLGYPDGYFNDRVVEAIDDLLSAPDLSEPPLLVRPHVLYEYADPELERLSSGQKLLLRMGPEHRRTIKQKLEELRKLIARLRQ